MPSQLAILLAAPSADEDDNPNEDAVAWCDSKLQQVREVLEAPAIRRHIDHVTLCWCEKRWDATKPHEETCQRTRDLMERIKIQ